MPDPQFVLDGWWNLDFAIELVEKF